VMFDGERSRDEVQSLISETVASRLGLP
jgi:hypothetical protein